MTNLSDAAARHRILTDFNTTLFVEAAAGTGKTTVLIGRIVALVRQGVSTLDRIVAVTFTEKAAGEMKLRLRTEIERARQDAAPQERERLERALSELELARVGTIHAFCGDLLHERPVEAGVDPLFEVAAEDEAEGLAGQTFESWFQAALANPPEGVRRILRRRSKGQRPREMMRGALGSLVEHRDFPATWRRDPLDRRSAIDTIMEQLMGVGSLASNSSRPGDYLTRKEAARLIRAARTPQAGLYLPLFILIGLYTGRRKEAILSLRWPQVNLDAQTINFEIAGRKRTSKRRGVIRIPPRLLPHLRRARRRGTDLGYVLHVDGERIRDVKKGFAAACKRAGIEGASPHTLKHTAATWLMQAGTDPWQAAGFLSTSVETLLRVYGHQHPDYQREAAENIGKRPRNVRVIA